MSLIMDKQEKVFDCSTIKRGDLISAQHSCWKEPKSGIVSAVTSEEIKILYQPAIANVTNFLTIQADDVVTGQWKIRWSENLESIEEYDPEKTEVKASDS